MRKTDLERFRRLLEAERDRVGKSLAKHSNIIKHEGDGPGPDLAKAHSNHMADQGTDEYQYEATIQFATTEGRYLYHIMEALARIEDGTYGRCESCNGQIAIERLKALPYTRLCIECKEKEEKEAD
ncbi:MAG: TraR/DksA family transcriptional regulator [Candidatus Krumholzibacteriia bacterium]